LGERGALRGIDPVARLLKWKTAFIYPAAEMGGKREMGNCHLPRDGKSKKGGCWRGKVGDNPNWVQDRNRVSYAKGGSIHCLLGSAGRITVGCV